MACRVIRSADGTTLATMCGPRPRRKSCQQTGCTREGELLCDYPLTGAAEGRTCSRYICRMHSAKEHDIDPTKTGDRDLCLAHVAMTRAKRAG